MRKFRTITLGCRVNQYETAFVREALLASGWEETSDAAAADLVLVNTCSVTAESDAKCRKIISGAGHDSPDAEIVVMGCYATADPAKIASYPRVSEVLTDKRRLAEFIARRGWRVPEGIASFGERHRAYVKIQDGCRVGCSYCIIPKVRPYLSSRREEDVLREIQLLEQRGYKEIVLSGIHLGHYGLDLIAADRKVSPTVLAEFLDERRQTAAENRHTLASLLRILLDGTSGVRFRFGSLEAVEVTDELAAMAEEPRVCPHFHLSMQSGADTVLARMRRRWPSAPFLERCRHLRNLIPDVALTTDIIVGFPGETDAEFAETCAAAEEARFSKIHIFRYSRRPGTEAAAMKDQVPEPVKKERAAKLGKIAAQLRADYARRFVGKKVTVLAESETGGTCEYFLPVRFSVSRAAPGELVDVCVESSDGETLIGDRR